MDRQVEQLAELFAGASSSSSPVIRSAKSPGDGQSTKDESEWEATRQKRKAVRGNAPNTGTASAPVSAMQKEKSNELAVLFDTGNNHQRHADSQKSKPSSSREHEDQYHHRHQRHHRPHRHHRSKDHDVPSSSVSASASGRNEAELLAANRARGEMKLNPDARPNRAYNAESELRDLFKPRVAPETESTRSASQANQKTLMLTSTRDGFLAPTSSLSAQDLWSRDNVLSTRGSNYSTRSSQQQLSSSPVAAPVPIKSTNSTRSENAEAESEYSSSASSSAQTPWYFVTPKASDDGILGAMGEDAISQLIQAAQDTQRSLASIKSSHQTWERIIHLAALEPNSTVFTVWAAITAAGRLVIDDRGGAWSMGAFARSFRRMGEPDKPHMQALPGRFFTYIDSLCARLRILYVLHACLMCCPLRGADSAQGALSTAIEELLIDIKQLSHSLRKGVKPGAVPRPTRAGALHMVKLIAHYAMLLVHRLVIMQKCPVLEGNYSIEVYSRRAVIHRAYDTAKVRADQHASIALVDASTLHEMVLALSHCVQITASLRIAPDHGGGGIEYARNMRAHLSVLRALLLMEAAYLRATLQYLLGQHAKRGLCDPPSISGDARCPGFHAEHEVGLTPIPAANLAVQVEAVSAQSERFAGQGVEVESGRVLVKCARSLLNLIPPGRSSVSMKPPSSVEILTLGFTHEFNTFDELHAFLSSDF
ncbi:hypothetical protein FVE85_1250 [Porphyridium purpureum]|uniref:Uncharacterized protein n=1 Tax=Porphyridium purpureum TaxID=35688 RepID=A0A5J4YJF6_PORPP|nr:hypothetical protein FVE85_1250 [Porphyridium purpureum]|eukprot:POR5707..scf251_18